MTTISAERIAQIEARREELQAAMATPGLDAQKTQTLRRLTRER